MGKIKSALEIALEKTEAVKSDKGSIGQFEAKQRGKKLANEFLDGSAAGAKFPEEEIKKTAKEEQSNLKQGMFDIFISQIALPDTKDDLKRIDAAGRGLHAVIGGKRFGEIARQLVQIMTQYLDEAAKYEEAIQRQYAPKLRQKEEELSRRMGRQVKLDPFQDPEFAAFFNQNMSTLKGNYQAAVDEVKEEALRLFTGN
jgi:hypothetical protein